MKINKDRILTAALAMLVLTGASGSSFAALSPEQASLRGVESMTVHASCCESAKEIGFSEEDIRRNIQRQLEDAGIKVRPPQMWRALPGRCRLRVAVKVYRPAHEETFVYNLKVDFLQTVTLERNPQTRIDVITWELMWFAHGPKSRLAQAIAQNLEVLTASFIKDYRQANPNNNDTRESRNSDNAPTDTKRRTKPKPGSSTGEYGFTGSKGSDVFHKSDCRWASSISAEKLMSYETRQEAVKAGKRPCKRCNP
ncbi:MAG: hypothetical protein ISS70_02785 [Phycisphaerae bacterium]|nr:hypothetical protein [Phycisphaerae bacterium]